MAALFHLYPEVSIFNCVEGMPTGKNAAALKLGRVRCCGEPGMEKWECASTTGGERHDRKRQAEFGEELSAAVQVIWFPPIKEGQQNSYSDVRNTFGAHIFTKGADLCGKAFTGIQQQGVPSYRAGTPSMVGTWVSQEAWGM